MAVEKKMAPRRATGRRLERHKVELREAYTVDIQSVSVKTYNVNRQFRSSLNLPEIKFFIFGKKHLAFFQTSFVIPAPVADSLLRQILLICAVHEH